MNRASAATDQALALTLKIGAYSSFASIVAGMIFGFITSYPMNRWLIIHGIKEVM